MPYLHEVVEVHRSSYCSLVVHFPVFREYWVCNVKLQLWVTGCARNLHASYRGGLVPFDWSDNFGLILAPNGINRNHDTTVGVSVDESYTVMSHSNYYYHNIITCFKPRCVNAEHSIYLTALILLANFWPCSLLIQDKFCSANTVNVSRSSLRSIFVPVTMEM